MRALLLAVASVSLACPLAGAANEADFVLDLSSNGEVQYTGPPGLATQTSAAPGERYSWNLTLARSYTVGEVRIHKTFDVERARQIVPEADDHYFAELHSSNLWDVDGPARVFNATGAQGEYVYRLGFPGPASSRLDLYRDVEPPRFTLGPITNLTHFSFLTTTTTNEYALADLLIRPAAAGEEVRNPTPTVALRQTFPVQGLKPDTQYVGRIRFWDWSENENESAPFTVQTLPKPNAEGPRLFDLEPAANTTAGPTATIRVSVDSPASPVRWDALRLFFDKKEVRDGIVVDNGSISYRPPLLAPGRHSVSLELENEAGGASVARWSFDVRNPDAIPAPPLGLLLATLGAVLAARRAGLRPDSETRPPRPRKGL